MAKMIRDVTADDIETTMKSIEACGMFTTDELPMLRSQLERTVSGRTDRAEFWIAEFESDGEGEACGVAYCVEEGLTDRVWNLLFIGVPEDAQGAGVGSRLLRQVEGRLREQSQRMLVIETTNGPEFDGARAFYERHDYSEEGTVRDFYAEGAHKIAFRKLL